MYLIYPKDNSIFSFEVGKTGGYYQQGKTSGILTVPTTLVLAKPILCSKMPIFMRLLRTAKVPQGFSPQNTQFNKYSGFQMRYYEKFTFNEHKNLKGQS